MEKNIYKIEKELFITSDEEIQEGDYGFDEVHKCVVKITKELINNYLYKKIILTTDQDLISKTCIHNFVNIINDGFECTKCKKHVLRSKITVSDTIKGVQAIDDEFLEWFIKNPGCEEVGIVVDKKLSSKSIYDAVEGDLVYSHHGYGGIINSLSKDVRVGIGNYIETAITSETGWETLDINNYKIYDKCYKIIIPKEEPKQETTLEEVAANLADPNLCKTDNWIAGAKWQQERMYSEEEVLKLLQKARYSNFNSLATEDWFKRFRKNKIT